MKRLPFSDSNPFDDFSKKEEVSDDNYDLPFSTWERYVESLGVRKQQIRTLDKKHKFILAFDRNGGNIGKSCIEAGIASRKTFYNWCKKDPMFKDAIYSHQKDKMKTMVDDLIMLKIAQDHGPTIRWFLSKYHPDYKRRRKPDMNYPGKLDPFKKWRNRPHV